MSKPITTVAMMILYDQKGFELNDNVSKYLPEFENMMCKRTVSFSRVKSK